MEDFEKLSKTKRFSVALLGDSSVGKTCLIKRFCEDRFVSKYIPTVGVDYGVRSVRLPNYENEVRVSFWDLSGAEEYLDVRKELYKDHNQTPFVHAIIIVFDMTERQSFQKVQSWIEEIRANGLISRENRVTMSIWGNKCERTSSNGVSALEAKKLCCELNASFYEVSANSGKNVSMAFDELFLTVSDILL